ncbi:MAG: ABC transporter permease [Planctomycetota bacterium]
MRLRVLFKVALTSLRSNALRSALTMLGVIIGTASVVAMVSVSAGARAEIDRAINRLGTNLLYVRPGARGAFGRGAGSSQPLSEDDVRALERKVAGISAASGELRGSSQIVGEGANWSSSILGIGVDYLEAVSWPLAAGRSFTPREVQTAAKVAILGQTVVRELFGGQDPIGRRIRIKKVPFKVIGVLGLKGQTGFGGDQDDVVMLPLASARNRVIGKSEVVARHVSTIVLEVAAGYDMKAVELEATALMRSRRRISAGQEDDFNVRNMAELISTRTATQSTLSLLLAATAAVSLIVGGIGIMNIMLVSVTERTREIGLRLAIGARQRDVMTQFLVEAVTLSVIGGAVGILLGVGGSALMATYGSWPILVSPEVLVVAAGFSFLVGVTFGYYPARKASLLNPIEALRFE